MTGVNYEYGKKILDIVPGKSKKKLMILLTV